MTYILKNKNGEILQDDWEWEGVLEFKTLHEAAEFLSYMLEEKASTVLDGWYAEEKKNETNI